jgi:hypothetical protein
MPENRACQSSTSRSLAPITVQEYLIGTRLAPYAAYAGVYRANPRRRPRPD